MCKKTSFLKLFQERHYSNENGKISSNCLYCGKYEVMTKDHIIPRSKHGINDPSNIALVCYECNQKKADLTILDFYTKLRKENGNYFFVKFCIDCGFVGCDDENVVNMYNFLDKVDKDSSIYILVFQ